MVTINKLGVYQRNNEPEKLHRRQHHCTHDWLFRLICQMNMQAFIYVYIYIYIYKYIYIYIYIHVYICIYIHIYICIHICIHRCMYCICMYAYTYIHINPCTPTYTHTYMHTYIIQLYICTYIHTYVYTCCVCAYPALTIPISLFRSSSIPFLKHAIQKPFTRSQVHCALRACRRHSKENHCVPNLLRYIHTYIHT